MRQDVGPTYEFVLRDMAKPVPEFGAQVTELSAVVLQECAAMLVQQRDPRIAQLYEDIVNQVCRSATSVGKNFFKAYGGRGNANGMKYIRISRGSFLETVYFLQCLPPPLCDSVRARFEQLQPALDAIVLGMCVAEGAPQMAAPKKRKRDAEENSLRVYEQAPVLFHRLAALSFDVIDRAIAWLSRSCNTIQFAVYGDALYHLVRNTTSAAANVIEGHGRMNNSVGLGFYRIAATSAHAALFLTRMLPPPFATDIHARMVVLVEQLDELLESVCRDLAQCNISNMVVIGGGVRGKPAESTFSGIAKE